MAASCSCDSSGFEVILVPQCVYRKRQRRDAVGAAKAGRKCCNRVAQHVYVRVVPGRHAKAGFGIELDWLDATCSFSVAELPVRIGRVPEADFVVSDPRVSRMHAIIDIRSGNFVLEDTSSYGTWVRFTGSDAIIALRRQECVLHCDGEIAMGAPFTDFSTPTMSFHLIEGSVALGRGLLRG